MDPTGTDAVIQVAEPLIAAGDPRVTQLVAEAGRGRFGGSADQVFRAALISALHAQDPVEKFVYLDSVFASPELTQVHGRVAHVLVEFLTNGSTWIDGDAVQSMLLLNAVVRDPRFADAAAAQLDSAKDREIPANARDLWAQALSRAQQLLIGRR